MGNIADIYGGQAFDPNAVDDAATGFDPLPAGWYPVQIEDAEVKDTNAGTGKYLKLELTVLDNPKGFAGRKFFPKITLINPNATAMEIGQRELAALGQACGLMALSDSAEVLGKMIQVRVKVVDDKQYGKDNEVTAYKALDGAPPAAAAPAQAPAQPATAPARAPAQPAAAPAATPGKRPWEK
jgi:hypothetical protein